MRVVRKICANIMLLIKHCIADSRAVFGAGANPAVVAHGSLVITGRPGQVLAYLQDGQSLVGLSCQMILCAATSNYGSDRTSNYGKTYP